VDLRFSFDIAITIRAIVSVAGVRERFHPALVAARA
jgi:hypothetical protein